ncbi:hypothetical protein [Flavobacterium sp.]|uniref:hypothetical protein n=1 Tax=Flavobacterium sp. TaxID=239 RepID=UPI0008C3984C|nr:hypothetical protein [Flavobacterium sp.]OGS61252.1 MAG: hypothetical protein A2X07_06355 [Flavobacteria bacterium GWF1_32_7]HBD25669.1 hypothetical protein [Flavobacterium sp.]
MKKVKTLLFPFLTILLGGFIYVSFRVESLRMFSWFNSISLYKVIIATRNYTLNYDFLIPDWVKFSLPDGLWLFSFISLILITWKNEINSSNLFWLIGLPIIALLSEIGQSISIVPGTFDWIDIAMYLIGFMLPFIINKKSLIIKL